MNHHQIIQRLPRGIWREILFTSAIWIVYLTIIAYRHDFRDMIAYADKNNLFDMTFKEVIRLSHEDFSPMLRLQDLFFTLNFFIFIFPINYWILPRFFYRKKYILTVVLALLAMAGCIMVEELVLEKIFYSNTPVADFVPDIFFSVLKVGPVFLLFIGFKLAWDNLHKQSQLEQMEKEHAQSQLQFLKSQLNPHFLFNNLNNLYSYAQENSPKTQEIILQLSAILRYMLYESREDFVPLEKELTYLGDFIRLQELQMENRGEVHFNIEGKPGHKQIAPLILIVFVENCFKHSLSSLSDNILIDIEAKIEDNRLIFTCANTYSDLEQSSKQIINSGIGLDNVKKRLQLLYPGKHLLRIESKNEIFRVELSLELSTTMFTSQIPETVKIQG